MTDPVRQGFEHIKDINLEAYVNTLSLQGELVFKDSVPTLVSLPTTGNSINDHRRVLADGYVRKWDGTGWVMPLLGGAVANTNDKWYFADYTALLNAYPIGQAGRYATNGGTDTIRVRDTDSGDWVDSGASGYDDIQEFVGSPKGVVTPLRSPRFGRDTSNDDMYISFGLTSNDRAGPLDYVVPVA